MSLEAEKVTERTRVEGTAGVSKGRHITYTCIYCIYKYTYTRIIYHAFIYTLHTDIYINTLHKKHIFISYTHYISYRIYMQNILYILKIKTLQLCHQLRPPETVDLHDVFFLQDEHTSI